MRVDAIKRNQPIKWYTLKTFFLFSIWRCKKKIYIIMEFYLVKIQSFVGISMPINFMNYISLIALYLRCSCIYLLKFEVLVSSSFQGLQIFFLSKQLLSYCIYSEVKNACVVSASCASLLHLFLVLYHFPRIKLGSLSTYFAHKS